MYTQQSQQLANIVGEYGTSQQAMAMLQTLANCSQPLTTRAPLQINGAASSRPPRAGYMTSFPNNGSGVWNQYSGNGWNPQDPSAPPTNDGNYWGGDIFYGDTNLQNILNENVSNWYQQQFTDNSYSDFRTMLDLQQNEYLQTVNNFEGDSYFDNTVTKNLVTNNTVLNQGDVINTSTVRNEGDVYNNNNTYLNENKTFITNEGVQVNLNQHIANVIFQVFNGGGGGGGGGGGVNQVINIFPILGILRAKGSVEIPSSFTLDQDTCAISYTTKTVELDLAVAAVR